MHFQLKKFAFFTHALSQNSSPGSYYYPPHTHKSSSPLGRKGGEKKFSDLSKVSPTRGYFRRWPFRYFCPFKLQKLTHCTLFRGLSSSNCPIFTNIIMPFLILTKCILGLSKICIAHKYFAIVNGPEIVAYPISAAKFYKILKAVI